MAQPFDILVEEFRRLSEATEEQLREEVGRVMEAAGKALWAVLKDPPPKLKDFPEFLTWLPEAITAEAATDDMDDADLPDEERQIGEGGLRRWDSYWLYALKWLWEFLGSGVPRPNDFLLLMPDSPDTNTFRFELDSILREHCMYSTQWYEDEWDRCYRAITRSSAIACRFLDSVLPAEIGGQAPAGGVGQQQAAPPPSSELMPSEVKAYQSYELAVAKMNPPPTTDLQAYEWLKEHGDHLGDDELPSFDTWQRQVRSGRKAHGTQKNTSRHGRETGPNVVRQDDL